MDVRGRRRWLLALIAVGCFPLTVPPLIVAFVILGFWVVAREVGLIRRVRRVPVYPLAIRSVWLLIAVAGLVALIKDIDALI